MNYPEARFEEFNPLRLNSVFNEIAAPISRMALLFTLIYIYKDFVSSGTSRLKTLSEG
jgi:hypothetical protein